MLMSSSSSEGGAVVDGTVHSPRLPQEAEGREPSNGPELRREVSTASSYGGGAAYFSDSELHLAPTASGAKCRVPKAYESLPDLDKDTPLLWGIANSQVSTYGPMDPHLPKPRGSNTPRSIIASDSEGYDNPIYYYTDSEQSYNASRASISLGLSHKTLDQISSLFRKHADGSFLSERAFVRSLQTVEPILYFSECSKLFDIYDEDGSGYVPYNTVVRDLQEIEVNGAMQAPILHFLSLKIAEHSIESNDLQSVFHFLVQGVRGLEILQRERAAWDETKMRTIIASTRNQKHDAVQSNPRMALRGLMLEFSRNLLRSQSENQSRTARMLAEIEWSKDQFEMQLQLMKMAEKAPRKDGEHEDKESEIDKMQGYVKQLYDNIETHETKLTQYDAFMKSVAKRVIEEERLKEKQAELNRINSEAFDFTDRRHIKQLENEISEVQSRVAKFQEYPRVSRIDFQDFLEIRKALLDKIHDSLVATKNKKLGLTQIEECAEVAKSYRSAISQLWELSLCMANLLRFLSLIFWALICIAYADYSRQKSDFDLQDAQFWIYNIPMAAIFLQQSYKFCYQLCYVQRQPHDYTGLILRPLRIGQFTVNRGLRCSFSCFDANSCCEFFFLNITFLFVYFMSIPTLFAFDLLG